MPGRYSQIETAVALEGEFAQLHEVLTDLSDHGRKRGYARWLSERSDPRGAFLAAVLDDWDTGKETLTDDESISRVWRDTCGVTLLQKLREGKLDAQAAAILSAARPALKLTPVPAEEDAPLGASKFGGRPDLTADEKWPEHQGKLHTFLGQLRLEDLQPAQAARLLPAQGLLSFFVFDDCSESGETAAAWRVLYTEDVSRLQRRDPPKEFEDDNRLAPEHLLHMSETLDLPYVSIYDLDSKYESLGGRRAKSLKLTREVGDAYEAILEALLPQREERSHLLGWSHPQVASDDPVEEGFQHLLTVASEDDLEWCWADGHQLYFSIKPDDLAAGRFERSAIIDG